MIQLAFVLPTGLMVVLAFLYLRKIADSRTASNWGWAWCWLYTAGITVALVDLWAGFMGLSMVANALFNGYILAGALAFARQTRAWIIPLAAALGVLRAACFFAGAEELALGVGLLCVFPMSVAAVVVVARAATGSEATAPDRVLAPVLAINAGLTAAAAVVPYYGLDTLPLVVAWANVGVLLVFLQLMALHERSGRIQSQLLRETRSQAEEIEEQRIILQALVDNVPAGIMLVDADARVKNMNRIGARNLDLGDPALWIGLPSSEVFDAILPRLSAESSTRLRMATDGANPEPFEADRGFEIDVVEPAPRKLVLYSRPVFSDDGASRIGHAWITWDVTEERELSERLHHAQRMEMLGTLAGGVAHDFNNQLTPILGNAHFLADAVPDDPALQEAAHDLQLSAEHCAELTRDLLAVGRRTPTRPRPVPPGPILDEVVKRVGAALPDAVELIVEVEEGVCSLRADPTQLQRVITNLLLNARDAVGDRGRIEIRVRNALGHGTSTEPTSVEFEVRDDGAGMDAETREHIFDPFFTTKTSGVGTGLGLSIVYGIVELHGGTIELDSRLGEGSRFLLRWPAHRAPSEATPSRADERKPSRGRETILLVEDEGTVRRLARRTLEEQGYCVVDAEDAVAAVDLYLQNAEQIELAVVDLTMPGRDGIELIGALREHRAGLPAILMSGHLDRDGLGAPDVDAELLPKPFEPDQLSAIVRRTLDAHLSHHSHRSSP